MASSGCTDTQIRALRRGNGVSASAAIEMAMAVSTVVLLFAWLLPADAAALPSCEAGPRTNGAAVEGTNCADVIVVRAEDVKRVEGGAGDDIIFVNGEVTVILGGEGDDHLYGEVPSARQLNKVVAKEAPESEAPIYRTEESPPEEERSGAVASEVKFGGDGNQTWYGGSGEDWFYGQRGNDTFWGGGGHDLLYGGPGDDSLHGQGGWDILGGGFGTDYLDGEADNDMARGDATTDTIVDSGGSGTDTLSFATATAPRVHRRLSDDRLPGGRRRARRIRPPRRCALQRRRGLRGLQRRGVDRWGL
jgi:hypothetical protein